MPFLLATHTPQSNYHASNIFLDASNKTNRPHYQKINASNIPFNAFELSHQADCNLFHASNYLFEAHNQHQQTSNYYRQA